MGQQAGSLFGSPSSNQSVLPSSTPLQASFVHLRGRILPTCTALKCWTLYRGKGIWLETCLEYAGTVGSCPAQKISSRLLKSVTDGSNSNWAKNLKQVWRRKNVTILPLLPLCDLQFCDMLHFLWFLLIENKVPSWFNIVVTRESNTGGDHPWGAAKLGLREPESGHPKPSLLRLHRSLWKYICLIHVFVFLQYCIDNFVLMYDIMFLAA